MIGLINITTFEGLKQLQQLGLYAYGYKSGLNPSYLILKPIKSEVLA